MAKKQDLRHIQGYVQYAKTELQDGQYGKSNKISIKIKDKYYSMFDNTFEVHVKKGDFVELFFTEKPNPRKPSEPYLNISTLNHIEPPIHLKVEEDIRQLCIMRQSCLKVAANMYNFDINEGINKLIALADNEDAEKHEQKILKEKLSKNANVVIATAKLLYHYASGQDVRAKINEKSTEAGSQAN